jgi:hypothetical protein
MSSFILQVAILQIIFHLKREMMNLASGDDSWKMCKIIAKGYSNAISTKNLLWSSFWELTL